MSSITISYAAATADNPRLAAIRDFVKACRSARETLLDVLEGLDPNDAPDLVVFSKWIDAQRIARVTMIQALMPEASRGCEAITVDDSNMTITFHGAKSTEYLNDDIK